MLDVDEERRTRLTRKWFGPKGGPHACPCCGYVTLPSRGCHSTCTVCWWDDDGREADDLDVTSPFNDGVSLRIARERFRHLGTSKPDRPGRKPTDDELPGRGLSPSQQALVAALTPAELVDVRTIPVGDRVSGVAVSRHQVVVTSERRIVSIDPHEQRSVWHVDLGPRQWLGEPMVTGERLWVSCPRERTLVRVDWVTGDVAARVAVGDTTVGATAGREGLWVTRRRVPQLCGFHCASGAQFAAVDVGAWSAGVAVGGGSVWVARSTPGAVYQLDALTTGVVDVVPVDEHPSELAYHEEVLWVVSHRHGTLTKIDLSAGKVAATVEVGDYPRRPVVGEGAVWVPNSGSGTVTKVDAATATILATVEVGCQPVDVAVGEGAVWVANARDGTVSCIRRAP